MGTVAGVGPGEVMEVKQVLKMLMIEASLVCCKTEMIDVGSFLVKEKTDGECESVNKIFGTTKVEENDKVNVTASDHVQFIADEEWNQDGDVICCTTSTDLTKNRCFQCNLNFYQTLDLDKHLEQEHGGKFHKCHECFKSFSTKSGLKLHIETVHMKISYSCNVCTSKFTQKSSLSEHMRAIHIVGKLLCNKCPHESESLYNLKKHKKLMHKVEKRDDDCVFSNETGEMSFKCHECDKSFRKRRIRQRHIEEIHMKITYSCNHCFKKFTRQTNLSRHIRILH